TPVPITCVLLSTTRVTSASFVLIVIELGLTVPTVPVTVLLALPPSRPTGKGAETRSRATVDAAIQRFMTTSLTADAVNILPYGPTVWRGLRPQLQTGHPLGVTRMA